MPTWKSWLGLGDDEEQDDPVQRTLDVLGQGAQTAGQAIGSVGQAVGSAVSDLGSRLTAPPTAGFPDPVAPSVDLGPAASDIGSTLASEGVVRPIARPISAAIRQATGQLPLTAEEEAARTPTSVRAIDEAVAATARSLPENVAAARSGLEEGSYGQAALGALGALGDLAPSTLLARQLNQMLPTADTSLGEVGAGDVVMTAALARDALRLGYGVIKAGGLLAAPIARAIAGDVPAERFVADGGLMELGGGLVPRRRIPPPAPGEMPVPGERGALALARAQEVEQAGGSGSTVAKYRALAGADVATKEELAERLRTVPLVTSEQARELLGDRPEYLEPVASFLLEQRGKLLNGDMTARDVAKAYYMTLMSMRSTAAEQRALEAKLGRGFTMASGEVVPPNPQLGNLDAMVDVNTGRPLGPIFTEANPRHGGPEVRPESLGAAWLWTDEGQRALNGMSEGEFIPEAWEAGRRARLAFGSDTVGGNGALRPLSAQEVAAGKVNMTNLPSFVDELNAGIQRLKAAGRESEIGAWVGQQAQRLNGISTGKNPFIKQLLGLGDAVTIDAREINYWLSGQGLLQGATGPGAALARATGLHWDTPAVRTTLQPRIQAAVEDLSSRYPELTAGINPEDAGHILHHWLWDRAGGSATAHRDVMTTQQLAAGLAPRLSPGLQADLFNAAQGGVLGAASESLQAQQEGRETDYGEQLRRAGMGAGLGVLAGNRAARQAALRGARELGSGVVPRGVPDPDEVAGLARRAAQTPMTGPHTNGQHVVRNVGREIEKQAARGVVPEHPEAPMAPPNAQPTWWDHAENWRYNLGLFGQLSTGLVQAAGGAVEALAGGAAEGVRLGLRGQPEAIPGILGGGLKGAVRGVGSALRTAAGDVPEAIEQGSDYRPSLARREAEAGHPGRALAANLVGAPGRVVTQAPDAFWHDVFYGAGLQQAAADAARAEIGGSPLRMPERVARQAELAANPTPELEAAATKLAQESTYKGEPGPIFGAPKLAARAIAEQLPSGVRPAAGAVGSFLMPIYNTIARIHERSLEYLPGVGLLPLNRLGLAPAESSRPLSRRLAQQVVGAGLVAGGLQYAASGGIRGPGPSNPNEAQAMRDQGYTPNSTNVGGYWIPNSWFGPYGPILNEIGAVNDAMLYDEGGKQWSDLEWWQKGNRLIKNSARAVQDYPALDTLSTVQELFTGDPTQAFTSLLGSIGAQYVPGPVRTVAGAGDPLARTRTRGDAVPPHQRVLETFEQRSGVGRQSLPAAQDILGRDVPNLRQGLAALLPRVGTDRPDPIIQAYLDADLTIGDPPKELTLAGVRPGTPKPELTPDEQRRWNAIRGEAIIRRLEGPVADPGFAALPLERRQQLLEKWRTEAGDEAHRRLRSEIGAQEIDRRISDLQRRKAS